MSLSNSPFAFTDCFAAMDAAISDPIGVRKRLDSLSAATHFRMRCNQARAINRRENLSTYPKDHPLHGRSQYDQLLIRIDGNYLYFEKRPSEAGDLESLSGTLVLPAPEPIRQLPAPTEPVDDFTGEALQPTFKRRL